ncbi:hypothetical protein D3C84_883640 [compost metagenome]
MVERIADSLDKRSSQVALTAQGKALIDKAVLTHTEIQELVLTPLDAEQRVLFAQLLKAMLAHLPGEGAPSQ